STQAAVTQSASTSHADPSWHAVQSDPPQSTSLSCPSLRPSVQVSPPSVRGGAPPASAPPPAVPPVPASTVAPPAPPRCGLLGPPALSSSSPEVVQAPTTPSATPAASRTPANASVRHESN